MDNLLSLIIVGAIAGTAAASVLSLRSRKNSSVMDWIRNTIIGILGAIVGGFLFDVLDLDLPDALDASVSLASVIIAFIGALLVIFVVGLIKKT